MDDKRNILFETKEDSNQRRTKEAVERNPHERFVFFLRLCEEMQLFNSDLPHPNRLKDNFIIE